MSDPDAGDRDLLRQGMPGARGARAALEQPQAAHPRPPQGVAGLRRAPREPRRSSWPPGSSCVRSRRTEPVDSGTATSPVDARPGFETRHPALDFVGSAMHAPQPRPFTAASLAQPPMADIGRVGWRKDSSSMPWPGRLVIIARRHWSAIWASVLSPRRAARRSDSSRANRQLRTWPSAVSRTRSQSPQNGRVTDAMTPTLAGPPSTRNVSAGALPRCSGSGVRVNSGLERGEDLRGGDHALARPVVLGVQRHLLDDPQLVVVVEAVAQQLGGVLVVDPAQQHRVDLDRSEPGAVRGLEPGQHVVEPVAAGDLVEQVAADGVQADVDAVEAGGRQGLGGAGETEGVRGQGDLGARG